MALGRKHLVFSGALRSGAVKGLSPGWLSRVCPECRVSQFEKGACVLFLLPHTRGKNPQPKASPEVQGAGSCGPWQSPSHSYAGDTAQPQPQPPPQDCAVLTAAHILTHYVSRPTGGIRNFKFSKQFQYFQYICWDFVMVHCHKASAPPTHRHWPVACPRCPWALLVQLRQ